MFAQYTAVPDANFENYLENNGMGDGIPNNGLVLTANINTVTELDVNQRVISDLTGIEDFTALEYLACGTNGLTSLDLSQNLALETLGCNNNILSSLDLSNNTALKLLYCPANNLTSLDLSQNVNLETVYCDENFLTTLTITSPVLDFLWCNFNQLSSLDLSSSPLLEVLMANFNQLNNVDISQSENLYDLGLGENNLTSLNLTQNTGLIYFSCSSNNISNLDLTQNNLLEDFTCVGNNLTTLDVSQNTNLRILRAYNNPQMGDLDIRNGNNQAIEFFDATNPNLECIFVDDASATYLDDWRIGPNTTFVNNEKECAALSIVDFTIDNFVMYPNPAQNRVSVIAATKGDYTLITAQGKIVKTGILNKGVNTINVANLSNGLYFLDIRSEDGKTIKKVIKE